VAGGRKGGGMSRDDTIDVGRLLVPPGAPVDPARPRTRAEAHPHRDGTRVVRIFLHLSRQEQRRRELQEMRRRLEAEA